MRPGEVILIAHVEVRRAISSAITQMRTGKITLRAYLLDASVGQVYVLSGHSPVKHVIAYLGSM